MVALSKTAEIFAGGPDRATGGVLSAPTGTALPTTIAAAPNVAFTDYGFVSSDGLSMSQGLSFEKIKEWGGDTVRNIQSEYSATFTWSFLETNASTTESFYGEANVAVTAGSPSAGALLAIKGNSIQAEPRSWIFRMVDGIRKTMIVVPVGQVTDRGDITFTRSGAVMYAITLEATPDASGNSFYMYTDNGVLVPTP